ncbi:DsbA family protein [Ensifer sp. P24N7]|uniref:DsbA family protein n=1 Tax=Sinorhizobium sp. P24N7 TaxID=3348358 RepID=UPI0035F4E268
MQRRQILKAATALSAAILFSARGSWSQDNLAKLMAPGPLPEKSFGFENAPVTVLEYASMTCGHCQNFHLNTWPEIKKQFVDTGKVRFILREFPFDPRATAAFMLARCVGEDKWYAAIDLLFRTQEKWARAEDGKQAMLQVMAITGMTESQFESCLSDQALLEKVNAVAATGRELGVDSTPTFFINGKMYAGALPLDEFKAIVDPLVEAAKR